MKIIKFIFGAIGLALLVAVVGMALLVTYLDRHKGVLELGASKALGREIRIEDGVDLHWSMTPSIALAGLWVGNPDWASGAYLARAERAVLRLDIAALLQRRLDVKRVTVQNADFVLETATDGRHNWSFGGDGPGGVDLRIDAVEVESARVRYHSSNDPGQRIEIAQLALLGLGGDEIELEAELTYRDVSFSVSGTSAANTASVSAGRPFTGRLTTDSAIIEFSGHTAAPLELSDLEVELHSDRLDLAQALSAVWPSSPIGGSLRKIAARLQTSGGTPQTLLGNLSGKLEIGSARVTLPAKSGGEATRFDLSGASLMLAPEQPVRLQTEVAYKDQSAHLELTGEPISALFRGDKPWQITGRATSGNLIVEVSGHTLSLRELADVELKLHADSLELPPALWPSAPVDGVLREVAGRLTTSGATLESLIGNLSGALEIGSARLMPLGRKTEEAKEIALSGASLRVAPKQPVRLQTGVLYEERSFQLELTGGTFADLFSDEKTWKKVKIAAKGRFHERPLEITGRIGPLTAVLAGRDLAIDLSFRQDGLKVRLDGTVAGFDRPQGSRLAIDASGSSLSRLTPWFGIDMPQSPPFSFAARTLAGERRLELKDLKAKIGESDLAGELSLPLVQGERFDGVLQSRSLDLTPFVSAGGEMAADADEILKREVPPETLQGFDGALRFEVGHLRVGDATLEEVKLDAALQRGHLKLTMTAGGERLSADVDLKPDDSQWRLMLHHKGKLDLAWLIDDEKAGGVHSQAPLAVDLTLNGTGRSPAAILGSADGHVEMVLGAGQLSEKVSGYLPLGGVLYTLLSTVNPQGKGKQQSSLECAVFQLDIAGGIATSTRGLALRTDKINVLGGGALRLRSGEIDLQFKTTPRHGLGLSVLGIAERFIRLTGTLRHPRVGVNLGGFLAHGAAAWATGGLSLLYETLFRRLTASSNPCETVLKAAKE